jgi:hypothetical protein
MTGYTPKPEVSVLTEHAVVQLLNRGTTCTRTFHPVLSKQ